MPPKVLDCFPGLIPEHLLVCVLQHFHGNANPAVAYKVQRLIGLQYAIFKSGNDDLDHAAISFATPSQTQIAVAIRRLVPDTQAQRRQAGTAGSTQLRCT